MRLSYYLNSLPSQEDLLRLLMQLKRSTPLASSEWEIRLPARMAKESPAEALPKELSRVNIVRNFRIRGEPKHASIARCQGEYILPLEAGAWPKNASAISIAVRKLDGDLNLAALVGMIDLPEGGRLVSPFPGIALSGATIYRKSALESIGWFDSKMSAVSGDYQTSLRLWIAGHRVGNCEQMHFECADEFEPRASVIDGETLRGNLRIANRFLPGKLRDAYWEDWLTRYSALAALGKKFDQAGLHLFAARLAALADGFGSHPRLSSSMVEEIFGFQKQSIAISQWARKGAIWRVVLADFGDNLFATYNACRASGLQIRCIADANPAFAGVEYRGIPVVPAQRAFEGGGIDGVIVTQLHPTLADARIESLCRFFKGPILRLAMPVEKVIEVPVSAPAKAAPLTITKSVPTKSKSLAA
jgi:GT2 family glycosyltransferase